jgi:hypothetical protein
MTNKDMVPRPGPGPAPHGRDAPKGPKRVDGRPTKQELNDPPDSPQVKPSQDRK